MSVADVLRELGSFAGGISSAEASRRLVVYGPNALVARGVSVWSVLARQLRSYLLLLLLFAAVVSAVISDLTEALIIGAIMALSIGLSFFNEYGSEKAVEELRSEIRHLAAVDRDGAPAEVAVTQLVQVLFTDKTGTLTQGQISFTQALDRAREPDDYICVLGLVCSDKSGNELDRALCAAPQPADSGDIPPTLDRVLFDSERQLASVHGDTQQGRMLISKGAPEAVLARCTTIPRRRSRPSTNSSPRARESSRSRVAPSPPTASPKTTSTASTSRASSASPIRSSPQLGREVRRQASNPSSPLPWGGTAMMPGTHNRAVPDVSVRRVGDRPVVEFGAVEGYGPIFNAGLLHHDGRFHLFARGVHDRYRRGDGTGPRFVDYVSDVLLFVSDDGASYEFQQVLARSSPDGVYSYEDPRVQRVHTPDGERIVISYTNLPAPGTSKSWRIGLHTLGYEQGHFMLNPTSGRVVGPDAEPNKDAVIFNLRDGRVALIHRIHPNMQLAVFDSLDELGDAPPGYWDACMNDLDRHTIIRPAESSLGVGAGAPPVATADGLILLYHERDRNEHYTTRAALLDDETGRVKSLLPEPIMRPELEWERVGDVDNVVFIQGAVPQPDGTIYVTYGAADRCVGAATVSTEGLLAALLAAA